MAFGRSRRSRNDVEKATSPDSLSKSQVKRASRTRMTWAALSSLFLLITVAFLIAVEVGDTGTSAGRDNIYFIKLDLSNVVPESVPNAFILNSIARTLGLHDYYTVGVWGFCEGYNGEGITDCSDPQALYYFNPVAIIADQLLAGASIQLPEQLSSILELIRVASRVMFGFFLAGACLSFVLIPIKPLMVRSRWWAFGIGVFGFINAALVVVAAVIGTVMFVIMRNVFEQATEVNIGATIGTTMFALMWVAAAFALFAWIIDLSLMCCCASRRDVRRGKKRGSSKAYSGNNAA